MTSAIRTPFTKHFPAAERLEAVTTFNANVVDPIARTIDADDVRSALQAADSALEFATELEAIDPAKAERILAIAERFETAGLAFSGTITKGGS